MDMLDQNNGLTYDERQVEKQLRENTEIWM